MFKRLTAVALSASLALTSLTAVPARAADSGEIARAILGASVLLYLGHELSRQNRGYTTRRYVEPRYDHDRLRRGLRHHRKVVPAACLRHNDYRDGPRRYFGRHCLSKRIDVSRLPDYCRTAIHTHRGWRTVYSAQCLRRDGWKFV